jgi:predicted RecA/RadA family phage recombinase
MAKNFVQVGDIIEVTAPSGGCTSGVGYAIGASLFGVAVVDAASGTPVNIGVTGVWTLPKVTTVQYLAGARLWWDDSAKTVTATTASNINIGVAVATGVTTATTINVLLKPETAAGL